jgi:UDP-N-acetylglucosamine 2-epimerase (non-hydrolysing)
MACTIVAKKMNIRVAHIEAGIRSGDISMPEEVNRIVTDSLSDFFFTTTINAGENLMKEGKSLESIFFVGNTMIDTLYANIEKLNKPILWENFKLSEKAYFLLTLHRPSNVDSLEKLENLIYVLLDNTGDYPLIFPVHPRTRKNLSEKIQKHPRLKIVDPLGYLEFMYLVKASVGVITDSGGITEETTVLGVPCITLRNTTERPETVEIGTNILVGNNKAMLAKSLLLLRSGKWKKGSIPNLWDGKTSTRIINQLQKILS